MKEQILTALRQRYANLGLGEKAFNGVADYLSTTITEESMIENGIAGVEGMLKSFQGDTDSVRTRKSELERKVAELEARANEGQPKQEPQTDPILSKLEEIARINAEAMKRLDQIENKSVHQTYAQMAEQRLKDKVVKDFYSPFLAEKTFTSEADVESFTSQIESVYKVAQQSQANEKLGRMGQPGRGNENPHKDEASQVEIERMAASMGLKK